MIDTREFSSLVDTLRSAGRSGRMVQVEVSRDGGAWTKFGHVVDESVASVFMRRAALVAKREGWDRKYRQVAVA